MSEKERGGGVVVPNYGLGASSPETSLKLFWKSRFAADGLDDSLSCGFLVFGFVAEVEAQTRAGVSLPPKPHS